MTDDTVPLARGQRIQVRLSRGMANEWVEGTVLDPDDMLVKLDEAPPEAGIPMIVDFPDIAAWRPADAPR